MSPIPIIERQRALSTVGEVRLGSEKQNGKVGRKLETFRLTSQQRDLIERAAERYGGEVKEWESPSGPAWQVITKRSALPILVVVGYSLTLLYEKWEGATKCTRRCDGEHEMISDAPCICNASGKDECDIVTRFMAVLPELGTSLGWKLRSIGERAADELNGGMAIATELAQGRTFVPATLRLTQRRSIKDGQVVRYVVPVLDFDPAQAIGPAPVEGELPAGYTPLRAIESGVSLEQGLAAASEQELTRSARSAAPIPAIDDIEFGDAPVPVEDPGASVPPPQVEATLSPASTPAPQASSDKPLTKAQATKLNIEVGWLRDEKQVISTEQLYAWVARHRSVSVEVMIDLTPSARDEAGVLHWGPLRDTLTRPEASALLDALQLKYGSKPKDAA
jgi:hypothetical protein